MHLLQPRNLKMTIIYECKESNSDYADYSN